MTIIHDGDWSFRYRVAWVLGVVDDDGEPEYAFADTPREFRTLKGAEARQTELRDQGKQSLLQVGIVRWMSHEEANSEAQRLQAEGGRLQ